MTSPTLAEADRAARDAVAALRESLHEAPLPLALFARVELVFERLEEANVHAELAHRARRPEHADAHAVLALALAEEALEHARPRVVEPVDGAREPASGVFTTDAPAAPVAATRVAWRRPAA